MYKAIIKPSSAYKQANTNSHTSLLAPHTQVQANTCSYTNIHPRPHPCVPTHKHTTYTYTTRTCHICKIIYFHPPKHTFTHQHTVLLSWHCCRGKLRQLHREKTGCAFVDGPQISHVRPTLSTAAVEGRAQL